MKRSISGLLAGTALAAFAMAAMAASVQAQIPVTDPATPPAGVAAHLAKAKAIAGSDPALNTLVTKGYWCQSPVEGGKILNAVRRKPGIVQNQLFDNVWQIGTPFVAVIVLKTSAGLVLFDSLENVDQAKTILVPGLRHFGLDPKDIKLVIVTHGHGDHYGGAKYLQETYHTPVALSEPDWDMTVGVTGRPGSADGDVAEGPPPARDKVLADGQTVTIGDASIKIVLTPGHTPGSVSAFIPVKDHGVTRTIAIWGNTAYPTAKSFWQALDGKYPGSDGAIALMGNSEVKFEKAIQETGAVGVLNTHHWAIGGPNPGVIGTANVLKTFHIMEECTAAARLWNDVEQPKNS